MRISDQCIILFGGGEKTAKTAQDCPNVRGHFRRANALSRSIDQALIEREITPTPYSGRLTISEPIPVRL